MNPENVINHCELDVKVIADLLVFNKKLVYNICMKPESNPALKHIH